MARKAEKQQSDLELQAISIVKGEVDSWENAIAYITDRVAYKMRELVRQCRKNYWGVFDEPYDPITGQMKTWPPLTEVFVESVIDKVDLGTKDINFRAKNKKGYATKEIIRALVKDYLDRTYFGEVLDQTERQLAIDGTRVWKTFESGGKMVRVDVDLLNIYIDPTANSIQEAYRFTERGLYTEDQTRGMDGWINTDLAKASVGLPTTDRDQLNSLTSSSTTKMVDVYEMWGKIPKYLITGAKEDTQEVDGHIVVSGLDANRPVCHLIEENKNKDKDGNIIKPYEECWYKRVPGRWYGKGIAEMLLMLQTWLNMVVNVRINRSRISQLGLWKIRKGSGVTPQMLSKLGTNGAVVLSSMDDLEQLVMQEASQSSYEDEKNIIDWAQRLTKAFEIVTGEKLPASTPATNAVIQDRNSKSTFTMIKEGISFFLQRWMDRHALPLIIKTTKGQDFFRIVNDDDKISEIYDRVAAFLVQEELGKRDPNSPPPSEAEVLDAIEEARSTLKRRGELFFDLLEELAADQVDTKVYITNEELDAAVLSDKLTAVLGIVPEYKDAILNQLFDLWGLDLPKLKAQQPSVGPQASLPDTTSTGIMQANSPQPVTTAANVPQL